MAQTSLPAQSMISDALAEAQQAAQQVQQQIQQSQSLANPQAAAMDTPKEVGPDPAQDDPKNTFARDMFGVTNPDQVLEYKGPHPNVTGKKVYLYKPDNTLHAFKDGTSPSEALEKIWDKRSPGIWGAAKGTALYGLPADMSSAVAYGLGGLGLNESAKDWKNYGDQVRKEYEDKYGRYMVPDVQKALEHGKVWDYALQALGQGAPYMGMALAGGALGLAGTGAAGLATATAEGGITTAGALGSFLGSTAVVSPVTIAQFADRQVAEMRKRGVEDPESKINWGNAVSMGVASTAIMSVPAESILFGKPLLSTLAGWGVKAGTPTSARMLASVADIAGTNALASSGAAFLSRANADMPLLDDEAKAEYLNGLVMGSLVGVPFGAWAGWHGGRPKTNTGKNNSIDDILAKEGTPVNEGGPKDPLAEPGEQQTTRPITQKDIIFDPKESYGINDVHDALSYFESLPSARNDIPRDDGQPRTGADDFKDMYQKMERPFSDEELIQQARMVKKQRDTHALAARVKDGVFFQSINDLPQMHSNDPKILTKAAALVDKYGEQDAFVRSLPDHVIEKLFKLKAARDLGKAAKASGETYNKEIFDKVLGQLTDHVDDQVMKDHQQYGSIYDRPAAKERIGQTIQEARKRIDNNPRKTLADLLMNTKTQEEVEALNRTKVNGANQSALDRFHETNRQAFIEEHGTPVEGEPFSDYAGIPIEKPTGLLEHNPTRKMTNPLDIIQAVNEKRKVMFEDDGEFGTKILLVKSMDSNNKNGYRISFFNKNNIPFDHEDFPNLRSAAERAAEWNSVRHPEYKPFDHNLAPADIAHVIAQAADRPGEHVTPTLSKQALVDLVTNGQLYKDLRKAGLIPSIEEQVKAIRNTEAAQLKEQKKAIQARKYEEAQLRTGEERAASPYPEPKLDAEGNPIIPKDSSAFSTTHPEQKPYKPTGMNLINEAAELKLKLLRDQLENIAVNKRQQILKDHPALGPALNAIAKKFAELSADTEIPTQTRSIKGSHGLLESLSRRAKVLSTIEKALESVGPTSAKSLSSILDNLISGKVVNKKDTNTILSLFDTAFNLTSKEGDIGNGVTPQAIAGLFRSFRDNVNTQKNAVFEKERKALIEWSTGSKINPTDLKGFDLKDIEAEAFVKYLKGELNRKFAKSADQHFKYFKSLEKALLRIKKELGDQGYSSTSDIFEFNKVSNERVPPEAQRPHVLSSRLVNDQNYKEGVAKVQEQKKAIDDAAAETNSSRDHDDFNEPPTGTTPPNTNRKEVLGGSANNVGGSLFSMWAFATSIAHQATKVPAIAIHYNDQLAKQQRTAEYKGEFTNKFNTVQQKYGWDVINDAHNLIAHMRKTDQKLIKDESGKLIFTRADGSPIALSDHYTNAILDLTDFYKEAMRKGEKTYRENLAEFGEQEEGLTPTSSFEHIQRVLDSYENKIKGNPFKSDQARFVARRDALEQIFDKIKGFNEHANAEVPYVPFLRFGDHVVHIVDKTTGKQVHFESLNDYNKFGSNAKGMTEKEARQAIEERGLFKKYPTSRYEISNFRMTHNNVGGLIQKGAVSNELLHGLIASGMNKHLKLADLLATGENNYKDIMNNISSAVAGSKERALRYIAARGVGRFSIKSDNIDGHSTDWARVVDSHINIWAGALATQSKMRDMIEHQAALHTDQNIQPHLAKYIERYLDYVNDPSSDYGGIRNFSFLWAMGLNPSSALMQLATLPNQALGNSLEISPNLLRNMGHLSASMARSAKYLSGDTKVLGDFTHNLIKTQPEHFRLGMGRELPELLLGKSNASKYEKGLVGINSFMGAMVGRAEHYTRISTFDFYHKLLSEHPENIRRALKVYEKDTNWQAFWENNKNKHSLETAMALFKMTEVHATFGKVARGDAQKGIFGAVFMPFLSFTQQMVEMQGRQLSGQRGIAGIQAGLYSMLCYGLMAGMAGIPGYELLKTIYEQYEQRVNGRTVDSELQMRESGMPLWLRKGLLSTATGTDISKRLGQNLIGEQLLVGLMKGSMKVGDLGGVPGRTFQNTIDALSEAMSGTSTKTTMELISPVLPTALGNFAKGVDLELNPESALRTKQGNMLDDPNKVDNSDIVKQTLGFTDLQKSEQRQQIYQRQRANQEFNLWKSRLTESAAHARYLMIQGARKGDAELRQQGSETLDSLQKRMRTYAKENGIILDPKFWTEFNGNVAKRLTQKLNPGKIIKPTAGEKRHLKALTTSEYE